MITVLKCFDDQSRSHFTIHDKSWRDENDEPLTDVDFWQWFPSLPSGCDHLEYAGGYLCRNAGPIRLGKRSRGGLTVALGDDLYDIEHIYLDSGSSSD